MCATKDVGKQQYAGPVPWMQSEAVTDTLSSIHWCIGSQWTSMSVETCQHWRPDGFIVLLNMSTSSRCTVVWKLMSGTAWVVRSLKGVRWCLEKPHMVMLSGRKKYTKYFISAIDFPAQSKPPPHQGYALSNYESPVVWYLVIFTVISAWQMINTFIFFFYYRFDSSFRNHCKNITVFKWKKNYFSSYLNTITSNIGACPLGRR